MRSNTAERICVSLLPRNTHELGEMVGSALDLGARLIELRLDGLSERDLLVAAKQLEGLDARKIVTIRPTREGGLYAGCEERRLELLRCVSPTADFVDLEHDVVYTDSRLVEEIRGLGVKVVYSRHFLGESLGGRELRRIVLEGLRVADIVKIVNSPAKASEAVEILALCSEIGFRGRLVAFSMGERWSLTRILSVLLGAPFTYASLPGRPVAPGQLNFTEAVEALEVLQSSWPSWPF
ncbi:MAG: type I 3-dehydroquinate dehydratase [Nitrososphaerota archaeon]|nr:type I 3-dehydroquinate dehydratase [Candidatus Calditenuaceae archaeon]MDW8074074.1 type I 3-dehydroquinate dehydratase [Nitrososphaerota archaeon]